MASTSQVSRRSSRPRVRPSTRCGRGCGRRPRWPTSARADGAILATRYYKAGAAEPFRTLDSPRSGMEEQGGHVLPLRLVARNVLRGTSTEVTVSDLVVNPPLDENLFSVTTLESQRPLH